jgi:hypothetical protein
MGDPVATGILIAGDNPVATDAVGARFMGVDPAARHGTPPFLLADNHIRLASELGLGSLSAEDIDLIGEMPSDRKPFSVLGGAESETFAQAMRSRKEVCRQAQQYFDDRDRYAREYLNEMVVLGNDKVLLHAPVGGTSSQAFFEAIGAEGLGLYDVFVKLVQAQEAELREPYDI